MFNKAGYGIPTVTGTLRVVPQQKYSLFVEVLRTDYEDVNEYADVIIVEVAYILMMLTMLLASGMVILHLVSFALHVLRYRVK